MNAKRWMAFLGALALAASAPANDFKITSHTVDGGGGYSSGGDFELEGTIGQPDAGPGTTGMSGGDFQLFGGFWPTAVASAPGGVCPDLDSNGTVDLADYTLFAACFAGPSLPAATECAAGVSADCDGDGDVDLVDFTLFSLQFGGA